MRKLKVLAVLTYVCMAVQIAMPQTGTPITIRFGDGCGAAKTAVHGMNDLGQVVGNLSLEGPQVGFVYQNGNFFTAVYKEVNAPAGAGTTLNGINNNGQAIGWFYGIDEFYALIREPDGQFQILAPPKDASEYRAMAINDHGDSVGSCGGPFPSRQYACMRSRNGKYTEIQPVPGMSLQPTYINNVKTIVGTVESTGSSLHSGFVTKPNGNLITFNCELNGAPLDTRPFGIADHGQIVGTCGNNVQSFIFIRNSHGDITLMSPPPGADYFVAVNKFGDLLGSRNFESPPAPIYACSEGILFPNAVPLRK